MAKGKPRSRIVTIEKIYDKPKEREMTDYSYFSYGIKLSDGSYANINVSAGSEEEAQAKAEPKFVVDIKTGEMIIEGQTYNLFEESTDEAEKYWNVKAFCKIEEEIVEETKQTPVESKEGVLQKEKTSSVGPSASQTNLNDYQKREERKQKMIVRQSSLNYATQIEGIFLTWNLKNILGEKDGVAIYEQAKKNIKATAKEYEQQIMENE